MKEVYLDHASTTYVDPRVAKEMERFFTDEFGNPGSFHSAGLKVKNQIDAARERVARILGCQPEEIVFTGSGTESINLAIKGVARALKDQGRHIITQKTEHHAVLDTCEYLQEEEGFDVTYLDVDKYGLVSPKDVGKAIRKDTILITIMYANNEIGTIQPIKEIGEISRKRGVYFHTDACQAAGYLDINVNNLTVDLMTLNGSKIYAPKGIGLLYKKQGVPIKPIIHGGGQEFGLRAGTENVPYIMGFAKALEIAEEEKAEESERLIKLRDGFIKGLIEKIPKTFLNGHPTKRLPNSINVSILDVEGESMVLELNEFDIYCSTGSACTSRSLDPSHVIIATGLPYEAAHGSLRFTLGRKTTEKDIDYVLEKLPSIVKRLREISPVKIGVKQVGR